MPRVSLLCPTRGRPENMRRFVESAQETADHPVEVVFYVDDDDPASAEVAIELGADFKVGPRIVLSEMWNRCFKLAEGDVLGHMGDDIIFRTPHWDTMVCAEFDNCPDRILFVHGRDGYHDANFGTHGFIHRRWVETVGYFCPPYFSSDWNDAWLNDVANLLGRRRFLADVYTEHMHYVFGKAAHDATYSEREARGAADHVYQLYQDKAGERAADADKLRAVIGG